MTTYVLAGGCFWCLDAVYRRLRGVESVVSGYAGGDLPYPSYEQVSLGNTGHAEAVQITFDESVIPSDVILDLFFLIHDPTTIDRQGNDVGTQYRSVIYYQNELQQQEAQQRIDKLKAEGLNIVTELSPMPSFYPAEDYHQNFFARNPNQGYCNFSIPPKLMKLRSKFQDLLKSE